MLKLIDGKEISLQERKELKKICNTLKEANLLPRLHIISVGNDPASKIYVKNKVKVGDEIGIKVCQHICNENVNRQELIDLIERLNSYEDVHGIMIQEPLPSHLEGISEYISQNKDVDGFTSKNLGKLILNEGFYYEPCTPKGIIKLLESYDIELKGKHVVMIGRSKIVGKPMAMMLTNKDATVTLCHSKTRDLEEICKSSDIIISAVGKPKFINKNFIGDNTRVIIDVGINRLENGKIIGDVDFKEISEVFNDRYNDNYITPVPGGVGPMTVTMLMKNVLIGMSNKYNKI